MFKVTFLIAVIGLLVFAMQTRAEVFTVEMVTDIESDQVYFFEPNNLVVQPGDTVTFVNLQEDFHNVVFERVPEGVDTIESPMLENASDTWSYTFSVEGTYSFHCHPHAGAGMSGTLIVGKPSETKSSGGGNHDSHSH
jgi:plastocyanin